MNRRFSVIVLALVVSAGRGGGAQTINGNADIAFGRSSTTTNDDTVQNTTLLQTYTVGYQSVLWDPRFLHYTSEFTFQRSGMTFGEQSGNAHSTGYNLGASLFPARPFPLTIRATRSGGVQAGNMPTSMPIRGSLVLAPGATPDFDTRTSSFGVNWQLTTENLPRIEFAYNRASTGVSLGSVDAEQRDRSLSGAITRETPTTRGTLRFQRTSFDNVTNEAFSQRLTDLAYEQTTKLSDRTRAALRAGYRQQYSLFDLPPQYTDVGRGAYLPPMRGAFAVYYGAASIDYQPAPKFTADLTVSYDRGEGDAASTSTGLLSSTARYEVGRGVSVYGSANAGVRGQQSGAERIDARTYNLIGGAMYNARVRFVQASASYDRGRGRNTQQSGASGDVNQWTGRGSVSIQPLQALNLATGYERSNSEDPVISFGNFDLERTHVTASSQATRRIRLQATWERSNVDRGRGADFGHAEYTIASGGMDAQLGRHARGSVALGQFQNRSRFGVDRSFYYNGLFDADFGRLHTSVSTRKENNRLGQTQIRQDGTYTAAIAEYHVRLFTFGIEQRFSAIALAIASTGRPVDVRGNQLLFRVTRRFAMDLSQ